MPQSQPTQPNTIVITNFGGRLTRKINGDLNSGFAKFTPSWGYDPFSKPDNLTWFEQPTSIAGIQDVIVGAKTRYEVSTQYVYAVGSAGNIYKIQPVSSGGSQINSIIAVGSVAANSPSFNFGASIEFFGDTEKIYVGSDSQVNSISFDFSGDAKIGTTGYISNVFRPLKQFAGKLFFGNGNTIGAIDSTGTVTSSIIGGGGSNRYSELNPSLSIESKITDLDSSVDGNYLIITASGIPNENIMTVSNDRQASSSSEGSLNLWNGSDKTITSYNTIPSYAITALQTYLQYNILFSDDSFGSSLTDGMSKILTLQGNKSPFANATIANGNFISWVSPEVSSNGNSLQGSLYYYGSLDQENPPGLYRILRYSSNLTNGFVYQTPINLLTNNKYSAVNNLVTSLVTWGYGQHYISSFEINSSNSSPSSTTGKLYSYLVTSTGTGTPNLGVYETQTQLFSKKITVKQIRIYCEPTVANNGFQVDCIGSDSKVMSNGTFTYTYAAGTDITKLQGSLDRIDFNPAMNTTYALGLRITNTGTANMTIHKIEIDVDQSGR